MTTALGSFEYSRASVRLKSRKGSVIRLLTQFSILRNPSCEFSDFESPTSAFLINRFSSLGQELSKVEGCGFRQPLGRHSRLVMTRHRVWADQPYKLGSLFRYSNSCENPIARYRHFNSTALVHALLHIHGRGMASFIQCNPALVTPLLSMLRKRFKGWKGSLPPRPSLAHPYWASPAFILSKHCL